MLSIQVQLSSAFDRLATLQRRVEANVNNRDELAQAISELEYGLSELRVAQEHLLARRHELDLTRVELQAEREKYWQLFDAAPDAYIVTTPGSRITDANRAAAELLNISQRFLTGKTLAIFVCRDRGRFLNDAARIAASGGSANVTFRVRPRERAPFDVGAKVSVHTAASDVELHWQLKPAVPQ